MKPENSMTAREIYRHCMHQQLRLAPHSYRFTFCSAGRRDFDRLRAEIVNSILSFSEFPEQRIFSELASRKVPCFEYNGVVVIRLAAADHGFYFS